MFDREAARRIAEGTTNQSVAINDVGVRELLHGWYFPYRPVAGPVAGSHGVVVNKTTGKVFALGSAFPAQRDLDLYDRGYQFARYDLVILAIFNVDATLDVLADLGLSVVEPTYEHGTVWRIPRRLTRDELALRVRQLPHVFADVGLYPKLEALERARADGYFQFEAHEFPSGKS